MLDSKTVSPALSLSLSARRIHHPYISYVSKIFVFISTLGEFRISLMMEKMTHHSNNQPGFLDLTNHRWVEKLFGLVFRKKFLFHTHHGFP